MAKPGITKDPTKNLQNIFPCGYCELNVKWTDSAICCDSCDIWFHRTCHDISVSTYEQLGNDSRLWKCYRCNNTSSDSFTYNLSYGYNNHSVSPPPICTSFKPTHSSSPTRATLQNKKLDRPIRILNINFQSASSKRAELPILLCETKPDIIIGSETWLDNTISSAEIFPPNYEYTVYRKDRNREGGGVLVAVHNNLASKAIPELSADPTCEIVWVEIKLKGCCDLHVGAFYRPHQGNAESVTALQESISRANKPNVHIVLGGDFNFPGIDWDTSTIKNTCQYPTLHNNFISILHDNGLEQIVTEPTRGDNTLDLLITNCPQLFQRVEVIPGLSDHNIPYCELHIRAKRQQQASRPKMIYSKADWDSLRVIATDISNKILDMPDDSSTEDLWCLFKETLISAISLHIPTKMISKKISLPWITPELKKLINKKNKLYRRQKKSGRADLKRTLSKLKREIQRKTRQEYWSFLNSIFSEDDDKQSNNKRLFTYVKTQKSSDIGIAPLRKNGLVYPDPKDQAEILSEQFTSVFGTGEVFSEAEFIDKTGMSTITPSNITTSPEINVTPPGVVKLLERLNPYKAGGPDGLGPRVLKELAKELAPGLATIYQRSLETGNIPHDWKTALVSPIYKKGCKSDPSNYRPISLTSILCKTLEHIITSNIMSHLEDNNLLWENQHGFRKNR